MASDFFKFLATAIFAFLLPRKQRIGWPWNDWLESGALQLFSILLHLALAIITWIFGLRHFIICYAHATLDGVDTAQPVCGSPLLTLLCFLSYPFSPLGFGASLYVVDSILRLLAIVAGETLPGSFFVWFPLVIWQRRAVLATPSCWFKSRGPHLLGVASGEGGALTVLYDAPQPDWHGLLTYSFHGSLHKLSAETIRAAGERTCYEYAFIPWPENEIVRRIIILDGIDFTEGAIERRNNFAEGHAP